MRTIVSIRSEESSPIVSVGSRAASLAIVWMCVGLFLVPRLGWSPCIVVAPASGPVVSVGQSAIYVIGEGESTRYRVVLIPQVQVRGNPSEFGILVPTPGEPTFDIVGSNVFSDAAFITRPQWRSRSGSGGCGILATDTDDVFLDGGGTLSPTSGRASGDSVTIASQQTVGAFNVTVLSARTSSALISWLDRHGYAHGVDDDTVLDAYVRDGWIFTAMRVDGRQLREGVSLFDTEPVAMIYETNSLTYPLRLAALSASRTDATRLVLYVIGRDRMSFDGARTRYANRISQIELDRIREDAPNFGALIARGNFVTKLQRDYALFEIKEDFDLLPTKEAEFQEVIFASAGLSGEWLSLLLLMAVVGIHNGIRRPRRRAAQSILGRKVG